MEMNKTEIELAQTIIRDAHVESINELDALDLARVGGGMHIDIFG